MNNATRPSTIIRNFGIASIAAMIFSIATLSLIPMTQAVGLLPYLDGAVYVTLGFFTGWLFVVATFTIYGSPVLLKNIVVLVSGTLGFTASLIIIYQATLTFHPIPRAWINSFTSFHFINRNVLFFAGSVPASLIWIALSRRRTEQGAAANPYPLRG